MKTLMSYLAVFALILTSSFTIHTQQELNQKTTGSCFNYLRTHRQSKNVVATWSVNTGDAVSFHIERSYDGDFFENAGTTESNGGSVYKFTDEGVFPGTIYYRITAVMADGSTEVSPVEAIRIMKHG